MVRELFLRGDPDGLPPGMVRIWVCLAIIGAWLLFFGFLLFEYHEEAAGDILFWLRAFGGPLVIYGLGRGLRYVFSGE
jgi:hypothetical protein